MLTNREVYHKLMRILEHAPGIGRNFKVTGIGQYTPSRTIFDDIHPSAIVWNIDDVVKSMGPDAWERHFTIRDIHGCWRTVKDVYLKGSAEISKPWLAYSIVFEPGNTIPGLNAIEA